MPRPVHFEIHADDTERASEFYGTTLGWQFQKWEGPHEYWMIVTGSDDAPGINGGLVKRMAPLNGDSVTAYVCTVDVPSLDEYIVKVLANGGGIALPKMAVPGVGWLAYCKDTEGNVFGMLQGDPTAA